MDTSDLGLISVSSKLLISIFHDQFTLADRACM